MPVGQNTTDRSGTNPFQYTAVYVMARQANTQVLLNGALKDTLGEGENYVVRVNQGDALTSSAPIQVHLLTGDIGSTYEMRWFSLAPRPDWSNDYYTPVGDDKGDTKVWLYNPHANSSIGVTYERRVGGSTTSSTIDVPARGTSLSPVIPSGSGGHFFAAGGEHFFALSQTDTTNSSTGGQIYDWGFPLSAADRLTTQALIGWGYGNTGNSPNVASRSVVWVTPLTSTTINVDFDGDGSVDNSINASALQSIKILDDNNVYSGAENDQDMTGALIFTENGAKIAVAWGQDPARSYSGDGQALDLGTTVPPLPILKVSKTATLHNDADGDGLFSPGDTILYSIRVVNPGIVDLPAGSFTVFDLVPTDTSYVLNSTNYDDGSSVTPIPDNTPSGTPFPMDGEGLDSIGVLARGG